MAGALGCCGETQDKGFNAMRRGNAMDMPHEPTALACGIGVGLDPVLISDRKCLSPQVLNPRIPRYVISSCVRVQLVWRLVFHV